jgi:hypothetical protein
MAQSTQIWKDLRRLLAFGSGVGIEIGVQDLTVVVARVRPNGVRVPGRLVIEDYASRPAAEWGAEYARFLKASGAERVSATVLLPRREVIVRHVALPGVAKKDIEGALRFQLDTLHPYGEDDIVWAWSPLAYGNVLVGIVRKQVIDQYVALFAEAGIAVSSFTFAAAAMHAAIRTNVAAERPGGFVALGRGTSGGVEVYGESPSRPVFSAEFEMAAERAASLAASELRLPADTEPRPLEEFLPLPVINPVENDLSRNARPYATALAGACPRLAPAANVLPPEHRRYTSRTVFIPSAVLALLVLMVGGSMAMYGSYSQRQYLQQIQAEIARLEPMRKRADTAERQAQQARVRAQVLDNFRQQTKKDLDALNELTKIMEPPAWTASMTLTRGDVRMGGEAQQTSALVRLLDNSPYFERTEPLASAPAPSGKGETFQLRTNRRNGK